MIDLEARLTAGAASGLDMHVKFETPSRWSITGSCSETRGTLEHPSILRSIDVNAIKFLMHLAGYFISI
jgi:hypothetical protein